MSAGRTEHAGGGPGTAEWLVAQWRELLDRPEVAPTDNFFDLGGHSVLAGHTIARIRARFGVDLPVRVVFDYPVPADLAAVVDRLAGASDEARPRFTVRRRDRADD